eukprot:Colp12_sorted_trinity150504_noHs@9626
MASKVTCVVWLLACIQFIQAVKVPLDLKYQELVELSKKSPLIELDTVKFGRYVYSSPRNYSSFVLFSASDAKHGCQPCRYVEHQFRDLANSWAQVDSHAGFFFIVDYDQGGKVFKKLDITTAPVIMHFAAKGRLEDADIYNMQRCVHQHLFYRIHIFLQPSTAGEILLTDSHAVRIR